VVQYQFGNDAELGAWASAAYLPRLFVGIVSTQLR